MFTRLDGCLDAPSSKFGIVQTFASMGFSSTMMAKMLPYQRSTTFGNNHHSDEQEKIEASCQWYLMKRRRFLITALPLSTHYLSKEKQ